MKSIIIMLLCCFIMINVKGQIKKRPCEAYPTSKELSSQLINKPVEINPSQFLLRCNVTDSIKKRLLYLLIPEWTKGEINNYIDTEFKKNYQWFDIEKTARSIANENDSLYKNAIDSLGDYWKKYFYTQMVEQHLMEGINGTILQTVAKLNMREAVPIIKKYFKSYDKDLAELCLARLGDVALQEKIISSCKVNNKLTGDNWLYDFEAKANKLAFIKTQECVYQLHNWLDSTQRYTALSSGAEGWTAYRVIGLLKGIIENEDFQLLTKNVEMLGLCPCSGQTVQKIKNWMIKNRGKYKIHTD